MYIGIEILEYFINIEIKHLNAKLPISVYT